MLWFRLQHIFLKLHRSVPYTTCSRKNFSHETITFRDDQWLHDRLFITSHMNTKLIGGVLALVAVMGTASAALAYRGDYQAVGPNHTAEREAQMTQAMTTKNYTLWKSLMEGRGRVAQVVNEGNFAQFAEAWKLGKEGKVAEADALRAELGLRTKNGKAVGAGYGQRGLGRGAGMGYGMHSAGVAR